MRAVVLLPILSLLPACTSAPAEMTDAERTQIEAEITDQWAGFKDAVLNEDYEGWASYWTPDARVLQPGMDLSGSDLFDFGRDFF
ncbi:MAG: hypothetical protein QQN63_12915, partial [Nitrosopumilus sp.]